MIQYALVSETKYIYCIRRVYCEDMLNHLQRNCCPSSQCFLYESPTRKNRILFGVEYLALYLLYHKKNGDFLALRQNLCISGHHCFFTGRYAKQKVRFLKSGKLLRFSSFVGSCRKLNNINQNQNLYFVNLDDAITIKGILPKIRKKGFYC